MSCENNIGQDYKTKTADKSFTNSAYFKYILNDYFSGLVLGIVENIMSQQKKDSSYLVT